ncbi:response regulator [Ktedonospora formicarum]|uniref:Response regulatory domain-containing protein n=1 Tax=Ktedonospora formicarum TaxID=2778364 RepID=A0A8J3HWD9_9CHLR|nr:response regulator [Ktedonospora formicarum]GHO44451.1 hypothetical protein KSX_26140 [Ktedonospora formicarum]
MQFIASSIENTFWYQEPVTEELMATYPQMSRDKTILIVEDDDQIGTILVETLKQETQYYPILVSDAWQALEAVHNTRPCLLITDYCLPSMNGLELHDRLSAEQAYANIPTILMSAFLPPAQEIRQRNLVAISKPFELDEFLDKIDLLLAC